MKHGFQPDARGEFLEAIAFYQSVNEGLGSAFALEIEAVVNLICQAPARWPVFEQDVRRCVARRFPFAILYSHEGDYILILAVMHCSRRPGYWKQRLG